MTIAPSTLREHAFRRELSVLSEKSKDALIRRLLIRRLERCVTFDLHKMRCIVKLVEKFTLPPKKKK